MKVRFHEILVILLAVLISYFKIGFADEGGIMGISLPGSWRPFNDKSPWNTLIPKDAKIHPMSSLIVKDMAKQRPYLSMVKRYQTPIWVVNSDKMELIRVRGTTIFDDWDRDMDGISDVGVPIHPSMWGEPTEDGQICVVDPFKMILWEMSSYVWVSGQDGLYPKCSTFDIWDLSGTGVADPPEGTRWVYRGGRGSGFPGIAGVIRPEELNYGEIRHALVFSYSRIQGCPIRGCQVFLPPACRSDGKAIGSIYPIMGMRFQLDPSLTVQDFKKWGLKREGLIIVKALQNYGMFLGITGGPMKLLPQLLAADPKESTAIWEKRFPSLFEEIEKIPTSAFRVIYTGEPKTRFWVGKQRLR